MVAKGKSDPFWTFSLKKVKTSEKIQNKFVTKVETNNKFMCDLILDLPPYQCTAFFKQIDEVSYW